MTYQRRAFATLTATVGVATLCPSCGHAGLRQSTYEAYRSAAPEQRVERPTVDPCAYAHCPSCHREMEWPGCTFTTT